MIGTPIPDPRLVVIDDLNRQIDQFFSGGGKVHSIPTGVGVDTPHLGTTGHHNRLRTARDKLAPSVKAQADLGLTASEAAKALGMHVKRVQLIARENNFRFSDS